jgi:hypothetical protein
MRHKFIIGLMTLLMLLVSVTPTQAATIGDKTRYFTSTTAVTGIQGHFSTAVSASLPVQTFTQDFYEEMRIAGSCMVAFVNLHKSVGFQATHSFGFANVCNGTTPYFRDTLSNTAFRDIYVRTLSYTEPAGSVGSRTISDETLIARIAKNASGNWDGYLFNHSTGVWDLKVTITGNAASDTYVSVYSYNDSVPTACSTLGTYGHLSIWDTKLQRGLGGAYNLVQFSDVDTLVSNTMHCVNTTSNPWQFSNISPADDLIVRTPAA